MSRHRPSQQIARQTAMAVTMTTHGHRMTAALAEQLRSAMHFSRLSVDGVGETYERLRGRPFSAVTAAAQLLRLVAPLGVNTVVNADTVGELDDIARFAVAVGASELLLLPQQPTAAGPGITSTDVARLIAWVRAADLPLRLAISRSGFEDAVGGVDVVPGEHPLDAHLHLDANGVLRPDAYAAVGVPVDESIVETVRALREAA